jgi:hypothetical protein
MIRVQGWRTTNPAPIFRIGLDYRRRTPTIGYLKLAISLSVAVWETGAMRMGSLPEQTAAIRTGKFVADFGYVGGDRYATGPSCSHLIQLKIWSLHNHQAYLELNIQHG